jgi:hypothetical protein
MVEVQWGRGLGRRIVGPYVWERENDWTQEVAPDFLLELLTNDGFRAVRDDMTKLGISEGMAEELLLLGVATWDQLAVADGKWLAARLDKVGTRKIHKWQVSACAAISERQEV